MAEPISVIILAAGESRRMGQPKLLLPWGETTVLGKVITTFAAGLVPVATDGWEIIVVTGAASRHVENLVLQLSNNYPVHTINNPDYANSGMLGSLQAGLRAVSSTGGAALIGLGDQPQVRPETIQSICAAYFQTGSSLVVPSFRQRRGHPWLASRSLWPEILALPATTTSRQFLNAHIKDIEYVPADESILQDLDTPEEYGRLKP